MGEISAGIRRIAEAISPAQRIWPCPDPRSSKLSRLPQRRRAASGEGRMGCARLSSEGIARGREVNSKSADGGPSREPPSADRSVLNHLHRELPEIRVDADVLTDGLDGPTA